jgi:hypothetical protein
MRASLCRDACSIIAAVFVSVFLALPAPQAASAGTLDSPPGHDARKKKDRDSSEASKDKKPEADKEEKKEPPFEKVVKDAREVKGLFTVYAKEDEGKYFLELAPDQLGKTFLISPTLVSGVGQGFIYPADVWPEYPVEFRRVGKSIQLIHLNTLFRASPTSSMARPAAVAAPESIVSQAKIESLPHPDRKSILVDFSSLFLGDLDGMGIYLKQVFETPWSYDKEGSSVAMVKGFPENFDFETLLHFRTGEIKNRPVYAPDPRSMLVRFHYSLSKLPATGYRPRLADDRVGHFLAMLDDYSEDKDDSPTVRYVNRWHLEKKDPQAAMSEPKEPIVFYLENSIPKEYREAVRQGVVRWNAAYEAIGFRNAVVAKDQPDDPDWDPADVRYSTLRWIVAPGAGFAQGPSRIDPYTGQIFDADIRFSADMIRFTKREFDEQVAPVSTPMLRGAQGPVAELVRSLTGWTALLGPISPETLVAAADGEDTLPAASILGSPWRRSAKGYCDYAQGALHQAAFGWSLLEGRGLLTPQAKEKYVNDFIIHVTLHEVGHTLGLRHNFKASQMWPYGSLQDAAATGREGLTGSVMDYIPVNIAADGQPQGEHWQTVVGPYDKWAIEYAYKPLAGAAPEEERQELDRIASRCADPRLSYGTDEDAWTGHPRGMDPNASMWDIGDDQFAYYRNRMAIAKEAIGKIETQFSEPGTRYQKLRLAFQMNLGEYFPVVLNLPKFVGGIRHYRDHIGDPSGRPPYVPVPAAEQREALAILNREVFGPDAFRFPARLLNRLAVERHPDIEGTIWQAERNDLPIHSMVLLVQTVPMQRLYHRITLDRLADLGARSDTGDGFTMAEMFGSVRKAVWSELGSRTSVTSFRRNLQRQHLQTLINLVVNLQAPVPEDARTLARADLIEIRRGIDSTAGGAARLDAVTRAHLDETKARINAALAAGIERRMAS